MKGQEGHCVTNFAHFAARPLNFEITRMISDPKIYMTKLLDSNWLTAEHFFVQYNTVQKESRVCSV